MVGELRALDGMDGWIDRYEKGLAPHVPTRPLWTGYSLCICRLKFEVLLTPKFESEMNLKAYKKATRVKRI